MSFELLGDVDWLAVILAALAYFVIGAAWYAPPLFGKAWMAAGGIPDPRESGGGGPGPAIYAVPLIGSVLSAIALGMIAVATDTIGEGVVLGLVVGVGFAISIALVTATFESAKPKPFVWGGINAGYHFVGNLVAAIIIAALA
jgi:hypothetical protein